MAVYAEAGWVVIEFLLNGHPVAKRRLSPDNARQFGGEAYDMAGYADIHRQRGVGH